MPQTSAYLSDQNDLPISDDTQRLDDSKPETWPLFLPSAVPKDDRSLSYKGIVETEQVLHLAQLQDSLEDLRRFRRALRNLRLYFKTNTAGEGQKTQTKSRTIETGVNNQIKRAVRRYRIAFRALLELDPTGAWTNEYHELRDEDNRGPLKEVEETRASDGRYIPSWIWASPSVATIPGEGSTAEQQEVNETVRHEWMTCRARADRWIEEVELLQEEMRRVVVYLEWKSRSWSEKVGVRSSSCTPDIQRGLDAYAHKQANVYREVAMSFAGQWLPYLKACGFKIKWATEVPWVSQVVSPETKLPKQFPVIPAHTPGVLPAADSLSSAEGPGLGQEYPDAHETRGEDNSYKGEDHCDGHRDNDNDDNDDDDGSDDDNDDNGNGNGNNDDGEERGSGGDHSEGEDFDDGAETSDWYDDEYMA